MSHPSEDSPAENQQGPSGQDLGGGRWDVSSMLSSLDGLSILEMGKWSLQEPCPRSKRRFLIITNSYMSALKNSYLKWLAFLLAG